jgi:hypothetical protein
MVCRVPGVTRGFAPGLAGRPGQGLGYGGFHYQIA